MAGLGRFLVLSLLVAVLVAAPADAQPPPLFETYTPNGFRDVFDGVQPPDTAPVTVPPPITGDPAADAYIQARGAARGYVLRHVPTVPLATTDGFPMQPAVATAWEQLQAAAAGAGHSIRIVSAHRSFDEQRSIFLGRLGGVSPSAIAAGQADAALDRVLALVAVPGYSKHHTGYALDIAHNGHPIFGNSPAFAWISANNYENAKRFGFVPSYPAGASNQGQGGEPWEYVYVGVERLTSCIGAAGPSTGEPAFGSLDTITPSLGGVTVGGWALDPDTPSPITIRVLIDRAEVASFSADRSRPDVGAAFSLGNDHGFREAIAVPPGNHQMCVVAVNSDGSGHDTVLASVSVTPGTGSDPVGNLETVLPIPEAIVVSGWALDEDTPDSVAVHVYVDGTLVAARDAARPRADVAAVFGGSRDRGFTLTIPTAVGSHEVCVFAFNVGGGTTNTSLGCRPVDVAPSAGPIGALDRVDRSGDTARLRGWALDFDEPSSAVGLHVYVDGIIVTVDAADDQRTDVGAVFQRGDQHGFEIPIAIGPGPHEVCVWALDLGGPPAPNVNLGCRAA